MSISQAAYDGLVSENLTLKARLAVCHALLLEAASYDITSELWKRIEAAISGVPILRCPCGAPLVRIEGGYFPSCVCAATNTVTVDGGEK